MTFRALSLGLCTAASSWGSAQELGSAVTPVEKVVALLGKLQAQVEHEGKEEAAAYDRYACFCKEEVDDKLYAVERSKEKIGKLDARIQKLGTDIASLDGEISELGQEIVRLGEDMSSAKATREQEHTGFRANLADVEGAISACERALEALKESKGSLRGKSELEALVQIQAAARAMLGAPSWGSLDLALTAKQPGKANEYKYHANDIIATIETLHGKFTAKKNELDQEEFDTNSAFEKRQLGLANEKKFSAKDKLEKEVLAEKKREEQGQAEADRSLEASEMAADQSFMDVLTTDCETKAHLWDQRSKTRADELHALSEAQVALKEGVAPNWQANKKLVGLQKASAAAASSAPRGHWVYVEEGPAGSRAASFLQLRGASKSALTKRASALLAQASKDLQSPFLAAAALKVSLSEDHFVKVRQIIKDLVARLESEADSERTQKQFCDLQMQLAVESRDKEQGKVEDFNGQITAKEADKAQLAEDIATLSKEIAANKKALLEATELRAAENLDNTKTIAEAGAGKEAVEQALQVLKVFYEGAAFVQKKFVPTNSDREGKTVADKAPEVFDSEYKGSQESSKGILGMLEVILADFDRTGTTVAGEEASAADDFEAFKQRSEANTKTQEGAKTAKEGEVTNIEDQLVELQDSLKTAENSHEHALQELAQLHSMCVAGEETYEERVEKRKKEIEALKQAHDILENWQ